MSHEAKVKLDLQGVPETLLWPLYNRAWVARQPGSPFRDPRAVAIADAIDYPFARNFGRPEAGYAARAGTIDGLVRRWLERHPDGTVVALGEGLETQFYRVDNGRVRWLAVDLHESIEARKRFLVDDARHQSLACSALDTRWMDEVDASRGVFITAAGLFLYFQPEDVLRLLAGIAERFPGAELTFDTIPRWFSRWTQRGFYQTRHYRVPPMPWGVDREEIYGLRAVHPAVESVGIVEFDCRHGFLFQWGYPLAMRVPWIRNKAPALVRLRVRAA